MARYTFHICHDDYTPTLVKALDLPEDASVAAAAGRLMQQHQAACIAVWQQYRIVVVRRRQAG